MLSAAENDDHLHAGISSERTTGGAGNFDRTGSRSSSPEGSSPCIKWLGSFAGGRQVRSLRFAGRLYVCEPCASTAHTRCGDSCSAYNLVPLRVSTSAKSSRVKARSLVPTSLNVARPSSRFVWPGAFKNAIHLDADAGDDAATENAQEASQAVALMQDLEAESKSHEEVRVDLAKGGCGCVLM